jgi:hypothetical protein
MAPVGSVHPALFFAGVYVVALMFSIFICSSLFYACNSSSTKNSNAQSTPVHMPKNELSIVAR